MSSRLAKADPCCHAVLLLVFMVTAAWTGVVGAQLKQQNCTPSSTSAPKAKPSSFLVPVKEPLLGKLSELLVGFLDLLVDAFDRRNKTQDDKITC